MCGLFGYVSHEAHDVPRARQALHSLTHRGPDQWGEWRDSRVYVGHRRLSILDLSERGRQPMVDEQDAVIIAVNGEVYNFQDLRSRLEGKHRFTSRSDSETVLHGYREWGALALLEKLEGMYALCIYDRRAGKVYLARDRVGIKPLYFALIGKTAAWASELKALERFFPADLLDVDASALYDFLTYRYIPSPKSLYRSIFKLDPACCLEIDVESLSTSKTSYWQLRPSQDRITPEAARERLRSLVGQAVRQQIVSDVPVGFFLSGGMDSSAVVAEAVRCASRVNTYSIGFDDESHDETGYAGIVAERFRTSHQRKILDRRSAMERFPMLRSWYDEPFADLSAFPTFLVSEHARQGSTVVLTGDGGDEVFGGYNWYRAFRRNRSSVLPALSALRPLFTRAKRLPRPGRLRNAVRFVEMLFHEDPLAVYTQLLGGMPADEKRAYKALWEIDDDYDDYWYFRKSYRTDLPLLTRLQYLDFHTYLPEDILTKVDRVSMAVSLEARVPLLSTALIEFLFSLPEPVRFLNGSLKGLMKAAYADVLPEKILSRPKKGFSVPLRTWRSGLLGGEWTPQEAILRRLYPELLEAQRPSTSRVD